jgi:molybdopterin converting factor small subunit
MEQEMGIKINIHPILRQYTNNQEIVEVTGNTVGKCLDNLIKQFPVIEKGIFDKDGKLLSYIDIYVNKESTSPKALNKPVKEGDELHTVILIGGG